jgi:hypothetical protein
MNLRNFYILGSFFTVSAAGMFSLAPTEARAQAAGGEDMQVLTRGPVHEAFAEAISLDPVEGMVVQATPPGLIEELPPNHELEGDNVTWISGYWAWDDDLNDFIWVSGIWRNMPPDRQWIPGYWTDLGDGQHQWTSGYWANAEVEEVAYVSTAPPRSLEVGPNIPAPSADHSWVPGNWVYADTNYNWRPGYWVTYRPNWTWMPSRYSWTRHGYVYVDGYWDYAVARRGMLFAPVYYNRPIYNTPDYYYTPAIVVALSVFADHLFIRPRHSHYYFGDYYAPRYRSSGFYASYYWHSSRGGYDPIYAYQRWDHRRDSGWEDRRRMNYNYFRDNESARPPRTWAAMRDYRDDRFDDRRNRRFADSLESVVAKPMEGQRFRALDEKRRENYVSQAREIRKFSGERRKLESQSVTTGDRSTAGRVDVREKFRRSPVIGRSADRFAKDEAPPARPEASTAARGKGSTERRETGRTEAAPPDVLRVAAEFRGIHGGGFGGEGLVGAGGLGAELVAQRVGAAWQGADEEIHGLVAGFHVGGESAVAGNEAAEGVEGFEAGGFGVGEDEVFVVVFAFEDEFHFDAVAGFHGRAICERFAAEAFDLLFDDEAGGVGDFGFLFEFDEFGNPALDFHFESGGAESVFEGEDFEVGVGIERALAGFVQFDDVFAGGHGFACQGDRAVEGEEVVAVDGDLAFGLAVDEDFDIHFRGVLAAGLEVCGDGLDGVGGVAGGFPVGRVLAVVDEVFDQPAGVGVLGFHGGEQFEIPCVGFDLAAIPEPPDSWCF